MRRPLAQRRPGGQKHAGDEERHDEYVHADAADAAVQERPETLPQEPAVAVHVGVAEEPFGTLAGKQAKGVRGRGEHEGDDDERDPPAHAARRAAVVSRHQQVGDEAEQERQRESQKPHEPAGGVAEPAAQRASVPAQVEDEREEHGQGHAGDRRQLVAVAIRGLVGLA